VLLLEFQKLLGLAALLVKPAAGQDLLNKAGGQHLKVHHNAHKLLSLCGAGHDLNIILARWGNGRQVLNVLNADWTCLDGAGGFAAQIINLFIDLSALKGHVDAYQPGLHIMHSIASNFEGDLTASCRWVWNELHDIWCERDLAHVTRCPSESVCIHDAQ
jgi:hypothetical protein